MNTEDKIRTVNALQFLLWEPRWPACVYHAYDADGNLLYIGSAADLNHRMGQHRVSSPWYPLMASYTEDWFPTRALAYEYEAEAIRTERPPWNGKTAPRVRP